MHAFIATVINFAIFFAIYWAAHMLLPPKGGGAVLMVAGIVQACIFWKSYRFFRREMNEGRPLKRVFFVILYLCNGALYFWAFASIMLGYVMFAYPQPGPALKNAPRSVERKSNAQRQ